MSLFPGQLQQPEGSSAHAWRRRRRRGRPGATASHRRRRRSVPERRCRPLLTSNTWAKSAPIATSRSTAAGCVDVCRTSISSCMPPAIQRRRITRHDDGRPRSGSTTRWTITAESGLGDVLVERLQHLSAHRQPEAGQVTAIVDDHPVGLSAEVAGALADDECPAVYQGERVRPADGWDRIGFRVERRVVRRHDHSVTGSARADRGNRSARD